MKILAAAFIAFFFTLPFNAQDFTISGHIDAYFSYDTDKYGNSLRKFAGTAPYRDEFRINIAQLTGMYTTERVRAALTLHYGDIASLNWPSNQQFIQEANAGFSPAKNLWIDAGYFLTHIGAEGVFPKGNFLTTLALVTYFEPIYQSGIKVSYDFSPKVNGCLHLVNGNNIFADNNVNKSAGITIGVKPNKNSEVIYNNLIGNEQPAGIPGKLRVYNNLVVKYALGKRVDLLGGFDLALQEKSKLMDSTESASLYGGLLAVKYKASKKFSVTARGEFYSDENGILSGVFINSDGEAIGLRAFGITLGMEVRPVENAYIRVEGRYLKSDSKQKIFFDNTDSKTEFIINTGVEF